MALTDSLYLRGLYVPLQKGIPPLHVKPLNGGGAHPRSLRPHRVFCLPDSARNPQAANLTPSFPRKIKAQEEPLDGALAGGDVL